jgi:hypothetical protein
MFKPLYSDSSPGAWKQGKKGLRTPLGDPAGQSLEAQQQYLTVTLWPVIKLT